MPPSKKKANQTEDNDIFRKKIFKQQIMELAEPWIEKAVTTILFKTFPEAKGHPFSFRTLEYIQKNEGSFEDFQQGDFWNLIVSKFGDDAGVKGSSLLTQTEFAEVVQSVLQKVKLQRQLNEIDKLKYQLHIVPKLVEIANNHGVIIRKLRDEYLAGGFYDDEEDKFVSIRDYSLFQKFLGRVKHADPGVYGNLLEDEFLDDRVAEMIFKAAEEQKQKPKSMFGFLKKSLKKMKKKIFK